MLQKVKGTSRRNLLIVLFINTNKMFYGIGLNKLIVKSNCVTLNVILVFMVYLHSSTEICV